MTLMKLTFKQYLLGSLLLVGLGPLLGVAAYMATESFKIKVEDTEHALKLIGLEVEKLNKNYMETVEGLLAINAADAQTLEALQAFKAGAADDALLQVPVNNDAYVARYTHQKEKTSGATPADMESWLQTDAKARALQALYISENTNKIGEKHLLNAGSGDLAYNTSHAIYHPHYRKLAETFGFYDVFLIDAASGRVVYSVFKEINFMASVREGYLSQSGLGQLAQRILEQGKPGDMMLQDFAPYAPSYNDLALFAGMPIVENGQTVAALIFQLPPDTFATMFGEIGEAGKTAEGYFYGKDMTLNTPAFRDKELVRGNTLPGTMKKALMQGFDHEHGTIVKTKDHAGNDITALVGYVKLDEKTTWGFLVSIEQSELLAPIYNALYFIMVIVGIVVVGVIVFAMWLTGFLSRPIRGFAQSFGQTSDQVLGGVRQMEDAVSSMIAASEETSSQSVVVRKNSREAAEYVSSVSASISELNTSIQDISRSIGETNLLIDDAVAKAQRTDDVVRGLGEASKRITEVVGLINDLADQTNLLALNAAIEAARAGDAGRGFAVVADEVKKLASNTAQATVEIREQAQGIQDVADQSVVALQSVVEAIYRIRDNATSVSAAVEEQSGVARTISDNVDEANHRVQQVDSNMVGIDQAAHDTGVAADQVSGAAKDVQKSFTEMKSSMNTVLENMGVK